MYKKYVKRWLGFAVVLCVLLVIWPLLAVIAVWLHFANKGTGAFFTQERPGKDLVRSSRRSDRGKTARYSR